MNWFFAYCDVIMAQWVMEQKCIVHNVIPQEVVLRKESPPEIWVWRFRSKQAIVRHNYYNVPGMFYRFEDKLQ